VGREHVITATDVLAEYGSDGTKLTYPPDAAVFPGTEQEVARILTLASESRFPVVPRGAGSGMSGGALPVQGGVVLSMNRFDRILAIDADNMIARVQPGVITSRLQEAVEALDLFYPPDPASAKISTIGGNVAECAGGLRAVKYGVTRDYVLGLTVVLPTGEVIHTGVETVKGVAGYDLTRLIVGSEGTLAVITGIVLRLVPKPRARRTMLAFFASVSSAVHAVSEIIRNKVVPSILEFMDRQSLNCVREEMELSIPAGADAMLLIEVDGDDILVERDADRIASLCGQQGAMAFEAASDPADADRLWEARRNVSPSLYRLRPHKISEDIVVPRNRMPALVEHLGLLSRKFGLPIPAFGHAGDGNIHVNIMLDKGVSQELQNAQAAVKELFEKVIQLGGTITGEHGVGITKAPYLEMEISRPGLELMARIKKAFDPKGILNPGKIFHYSI
jgi:glycolate oxidase